MIPQHTIQDIRERAADDIVDIIGEQLQLKRSGASYKAACPFHEENTPSFSVSEAKGIYKCFGCGEGGDAIDFIMKHEGLEFMEVIRRLGRRYMIDVSGGSGSRNAGRSQKDIYEAILPGIAQMKSRIRRQDYVLLFLDAELAGQHANLGRLPWLQVDPPVSRGQFQIIKKYTNTVFLSAQGYDRDLLLQMISNAVQAGLSLKVQHSFTEAENGGGIEAAYTQDWVRYLMQTYRQTDGLIKEIKSIIAQIPDELTYGIYQQEFIKQLHLTDEKK